MKNIVLFDMDGTLTEPRQKMGIQMEQQLLKLQESGYEIGIITGSDMNYVKQQCSGLFDLIIVIIPFFLTKASTSGFSKAKPTSQSSDFFLGAAKVNFIYL